MSAATAAVEQSMVQGTLDIAAWMREQNMTELTAGVYDIPVDFEVPGDVVIENEVIARVTIKAVEEEE